MIKLLKSVLLLSFSIFLCANTNFVFAEDLNHQINLIERLARIEEGQKAIISEMKTRFESFYREMNQRFGAVDQRFESVDQRFESLDKRFEAIDQRFESLEKRIDMLSNYIIAMIGMFITIFLSIIGYAIWERKTNAKNEKISQPAYFSPLNTDQAKINQMLDIMKQMSEKIPEMKEMMRAANLL